MLILSIPNKYDRNIQLIFFYMCLNFITMDVIDCFIYASSLNKHLFNNYMCVPINFKHHLYFHILYNILMGLQMHIM